MRDREIVVLENKLERIREEISQHDENIDRLILRIGQLESEVEDLKSLKERIYALEVPT